MKYLSSRISRQVDVAKKIKISNIHPLPEWYIEATPDDLTCAISIKLHCAIGKDGWSKWKLDLMQLTIN